jgi:dipeptide/tripeptide permease
MSRTLTRSLLLAPVLILLAPLAATLFGSGVAWDPFDFFGMGVLLYGAVAAYLVLARFAGGRRGRVVLGFAILSVVLWLWAELAVGVLTGWGT